MSRFAAKPRSSGVERIADRVWLVRAPIGDLEVCIYIIRGSRLAVIDTGFIHHPAERLIPALADIGLRLDEIDLILNTHAHPDHIGGNAMVKEAGGARVLLHRDDVPLASAANMAAGIGLLRAMRSLGMSDQADRHEALVRSRIGRDVGVDQALEDGDVVDLGAGVSLQVVHAPGHTPGSVVFFDERKRIAFTGDAVQGFGVARGSLPTYSDAVQFQRSLQLLDELAIATLCLGHPFRWSGSREQSSPIRRGDQVGRTLADSLFTTRAIERAANAADAENRNDLRARLRGALELLDEPLRPNDVTGDLSLLGGAVALLAHFDAYEERSNPTT